jgi:hypothetical protein
MAKSKFTLTSEIVRVEKEPEVINFDQTMSPPIVKPSKERISMNIDADLKTKLQFYCLKSRKNMTEVFEEAVRVYLKNEGAL